ncbi:MAG TPA: HAMP domain-containing protein, partial [Actinomycetota bacterium]|nr:HAMP domain-containing protein [Actinomycetota bacterium]
MAPEVTEEVPSPNAVPGSNGGFPEASNGGSPRSANGRRGRKVPQGLDTAQGSDAFLAELLAAVTAARAGRQDVRMSAGHTGVAGEVAAALNDLIGLNAGLTGELQRVAHVVGRDGVMTERVHLDAAGGAWGSAVEAVNSLVDDLVRPTNEVARVLSAVAEGDLDQKMALTIEGRPVKGEFQRIGRVVNSMVDQLSSFSAEVSRVAREVGTEGKLGGQARVEGVSGTWKDLTHSVNLMASNLTDQVRNIALVTTAVANGDLSKKITVDARGEVAQLKDTINTMV